MEVGPLWFLYLVASLHSHNLCRKGWYHQHSHNLCGNSNSYKACGNGILWQIMPTWDDSNIWLVADPLVSVLFWDNQDPVLSSWELLCHHTTLESKYHPSQLTCGVEGLLTSEGWMEAQIQSLGFWPLPYIILFDSFWGITITSFNRVLVQFYLRKQWFI